MISVLLLGPSLSAVSGVSTHLNQLFNSSLKREFHLEHFQVGSEGRKENNYSRLYRFIFSPVALGVKLIRLRPDIVHLNTSLEPKSFWRDALYLLVAKLLGRRVVYQVHGGALPREFFGGNWLLTTFLKRLLQLPEVVVLLARIEQQAYRSFAQFKCLQVIPNAIAVDEYAVHENKRYDSDKLRLVYIGRLAGNKGISEAIESLHILHEQGLENLTLSIAGSGPAEHALKGKVRELKLEDSVDFIGPIFGRSKTEFWHRADIFIFPTFHREGLPYTVLESLASGTPMITTRVGGIVDAIKDGVHGVFVEPHDSPAVATAIMNLASNRSRLREMSKACILRAREQYSIERLAGQFSELYKTVLK